MANQIIIDIGAVANDGTGDPLRTAFGYVNNNFSNVWASGVANSNIQFNGNRILTTNTNGNLVLAPNGIGKVQANVDIVPNANNTLSLGSLTRQWNTVYARNLEVAGDTTFNNLTVNGNLTVDGDIIQIGNLVTDAKTIQLANTASTANAANGSGITVGANDNIATLLYSSTSNVWTTNIGLSSVGNITAPYFFGNGSQLTGLPVQYGNANVVTLLAAFGSNTITTTGNITGGFILGNISQANGFPATYGNSNVTTLLSNLGSNIINGTGNITTTGNITGGNLISSTLNNNGNISVVASGNTWTFGSTGNLTVPATNSVPGQISTQTTLASEKGFDLRITAGNTNGCSVPGGDLYLSTGVGYNGISHGAGNVNIVTGDRYGNINGNIWRFDSSGALTLPLGNIKIKGTVGNSIAFGLNAGQISQGTEAVAIGSLAGNNRQGNNSVAIGNTAGAGGSVSTNYVSGAESPSTTLVVTSTTGIGPGMIISGTGFFGNITVVTVTNSTTLEISASAGFTPSGVLTFTGSQGDEAVAIGPSAGSTNQGSGAVAVGGLAGYNLQGDNAVAIGGLAGNNSQGTQAVAVGLFAGQEDQGQFSVAIGGGAGQQTQGEESVAIGAGAGSTVQGNAAVAIGGGAGAANQRINSVAIGASAGAGTQGQYAVAIGASAGVTNQGNNSIILNATGANLNQTTANTFTVAPVRNDVANTAQVMFYNTTSKEVTYGNVISVAGNITGNYILGNGSQLTGLPATYGNANVATFLAAYGSNTISTSGNVTVGNLITSGNISMDWLDVGNIGNIAVLAADVKLQITADAGNTAPYWTFNNDGTLYVPGNISGDNSAPLIVEGSGSGEGYISLPHATFGGEQVAIVNKFSLGNGIRLETNGGNLVFDNAGNLTVPGNIIMPSLTSLIGSGASPGPSISGFSSVTANTLSATGNITGGNIITANAASVILGNAVSLIKQNGSNATVNLSGSVTLSPDTAASANNGVVIGGNGYLLAPNGSRNAVLNYNGASGTMGIYSVNVYGNIATAIENGGANGVGNIGANASNRFNTVFARSGDFSGNVTAANFVGNINITGNVQGTSSNVTLVAGSYSWTFDNTGNTQGNLSLTGANITINNAPGGNEGAEIKWALPSPANTVLSTSLVQDVFQNGMRFFEAGGNTRGLYMDLGNVPNGSTTAVGYRDIPQVSFAGNTTIATTDAGRHYYSTQSSNYILTIANNASQGFQVGAAITVVNQGTGNITVAQGSGVTLYLAGNATSGNRTVSTFGMATIIKVATDTWFISGAGVA
jgi:hypothetical protein